MFPARVSVRDPKFLVWYFRCVMPSRKILLSDSGSALWVVILTEWVAKCTVFVL